MRIKTAALMTDLSGKPLKDGETNLTFGKALANICVSDQSGANQMKFYNLAQKFYNDEEVTLDSADTELLKTAVEKTKTYLPLVTGQIQEFLLKSKEKEDDKKKTK